MIEHLPEWAQVLFEPFNRFALETVGVWYVGTLVVMFSLGYLAKALGVETENPLEGHSLVEKLALAGVAAPVFEELVFRIAPMWLGLSTTAVIVVSVVWAFLHGKRWLLIMVTVPLYVKMALAGMFVELIFVHAFHNTWAVLLSHFAPDEWGDDDSDDVRDLEEIESGEASDSGTASDLRELEDDDELIDAIAHKLEHDPDFDPQVTVNGTTYESMDDVPTGELIQLFGDDESWDDPRDD